VKFKERLKKTKKEDEKTSPGYFSLYSICFGNNFQNLIDSG